MQEVISLFIVFSLMLLFFGASMNVYHAFFSDVELVADGVHIADETDNKIEKKKISRLSAEKKVNGKENMKSKLKTSPIKYNSQKISKKRTVSKTEKKAGASKAYTKKYNSYREFKKYNTVSR